MNIKKLQTIGAKKIRRDINTLILGDFIKKYTKNGCFETEQEVRNYYWKKFNNLNNN